MYMVCPDHICPRRFGAPDKVCVNLAEPSRRERSNPCTHLGRRDMGASGLLPRSAAALTPRDEMGRRLSVHLLYQAHRAHRLIRIIGSSGPCPSPSPTAITRPLDQWLKAREPLREEALLDYSVLCRQQSSCQRTAVGRWRPSRDRVAAAVEKGLRSKPGANKKAVQILLACVAPAPRRRLRACLIPRACMAASARPNRFPSAVVFARS